MKEISLEEILKDLLEMEDEVFCLKMPNGRIVFTSCCTANYSNYGN